MLTKYYQRRNRNIHIHKYERKKNTRWVTVLPIWTCMCLLLEVKGQCYMKPCHFPQLKKQHFWKSQSSPVVKWGVTGCPVCCTSHCGSTVKLAMKTAPGSSEGPCRWRSLRSIWIVCTTTPARTGYSATSPLVAETKDANTVSRVIKYLMQMSFRDGCHYTKSLMCFLSLSLVAASCSCIFSTDEWVVSIFPFNLLQQDKTTQIYC